MAVVGEAVVEEGEVEVVEGGEVDHQEGVEATGAARVPTAMMHNKSVNR